MILIRLIILLIGIAANSLIFGNGEYKKELDVDINYLHSLSLSSFHPKNETTIHGRLLTATNKIIDKKNNPKHLLEELWTGYVNNRPNFIPSTLFSKADVCTTPTCTSLYLLSAKKPRLI